MTWWDAWGEFVVGLIVGGILGAWLGVHLPRFVNRPRLIPESPVYRDHWAGPTGVPVELAPIGRVYRGPADPAKNCVAWLQPKRGSGDKPIRLEWDDGSGGRLRGIDEMKPEQQYVIWVDIPGKGPHPTLPAQDAKHPAPRARRQDRRDRVIRVTHKYGPAMRIRLITMVTGGGGWHYRASLPWIDELIRKYRVWRWARENR